MWNERIGSVERRHWKSSVHLNMWCPIPSYCLWHLKFFICFSSNGVEWCFFTEVVLYWHFNFSKSHTEHSWCNDVCNVVQPSSSIVFRISSRTNRSPYFLMSKCEPEGVIYVTLFILCQFSYVGEWRFQNFRFCLSVIGLVLSFE